MSKMNGYGNQKQPTANTSIKLESYTSEEVDRIKIELNKTLGPEYVSMRPAAGGSKVHYIEGWRAINLANEVLGFNGWSSEIKGTQVDYVDDHGGSGKYSIGLSITVRITLKDGTYREDIGYGHIENCRSRASAFEKCKKEAVTDALKRALRSFGNVLGNCLYDKDYLAKIKKVKAVPAEFQESDLLRPEYVRRQLPPTLPIAPISNKAANVAVPSRPPQPLPIKPAVAAPPENFRTPLNNKTKDKTNVIEDIDMADEFDDSFMFSDNNELDDYEMMLITAEHKSQDGVNSANSAVNGISLHSKPNEENAKSTTPQGSQPEEPKIVGFFSAKAADTVQANSPATVPHFNTRGTNSVFKSGKVDQSKSTPIKRTSLPSTPRATSPYVNGPTSGAAKRVVGMPPGARNGPPSKKPHVEE